MSIVKQLSHFGSSMSLLIVEDEKELTGELVDLLKVFFKSVDFAYNGEEALKKYKKNRSDIILTDITMPKMNGITMSRKIKAINPEQAIIVLSAHGDTKYMIELIDINIDQFILKPFDKNTLFFKLLKVAEYLDYKREFEIFYKKKHREMLLNTLEIDEKDAQNLDDAQMEAAIQNEDYHFSHTKEGANDFMEAIQGDNLLWEAFKDDIPELLQLSEEFGEDIDKLDLEDLNEETRDSMVQTIHGYILIFSTLDQMVRMTEVLGQLTQFLEDLDIPSLTATQQKKLKVLEFIHNDIARFLQTVFIYKDSVDIYYLEDSLESSIARLKNDVLGIEIEEDELELF